MPEPIRTPPLASAVASHLEELILEGALRPGERLAAERELAEALGVSRPSLREALVMLERKGLLAGSRNGTVVADFLAPLSGPLEGLFGRNSRAAGDYFEYRRLIEPEAAVLAARRITPPERMALEECLVAMKAAHARAVPAEEAAEDLRLHQIVHEAAHNLVMLHVLRVFSGLLKRGIFLSHEQYWQRDALRAAILEQHQALGDAILRGDAGVAGEAMRAHIAFTETAFHELRREASRLSETLRKRDVRALVSTPARRGGGMA
ncbi:FadR family transcriptional regulator [Roseomonas sp. M0104]|uniref:Pyruvate dehydrogenase complex repressor n=1 Tax=Teichococcus coralli TaxID=2545983 RepID=A0A845BCU8_9PROT|nr:FadR/GntR family transcriptional regulator [Pseudoroseomonas coralli]MXP63167.1 FadR family transcriptional regulator [Pseudoroseomonas coralli]